MASVKPLCHFHLPLSSSSSFFRIRKPTHSLPLSPRLLNRPIQFQSKTLSPPHRIHLLPQPLHAYVTGPASDPNIADTDPKLDGLRQEDSPTPRVVTWELLSMLLMKHKFRLALCVASLFACTTCTLSMPIFSGDFFLWIFLSLHKFYLFILLQIW